MDLCDFVTFTLPGVQAGAKLTKEELKGLAARLQAGMAARGFAAGEASDLFGSSTDTWIFTITMEEAGFSLSIDAAPDQRDPAPDHWVSMVWSEEVDGARTGSAERMAAVARVECALHRVYSDDLKVGALDWRLRRTYDNIDDYVSFLLPGSGGPREADVERMAERLRKALESRGQVVQPFGTSRDYRGFVVRAPASKIVIGVTPDVTAGRCEAPPDRWSVQVYLHRGGWFRSTRARRSDDFLAVEKSVRQALVHLGARDISLLPWMGRHPERAPSI